MNTSQINSLKPAILIVDDTLQNIQLMTDMLSKNGYSVTAAPDGPTALMIAGNEPPDLILLDIRMPDMDGYEVCTRLKSDAKTHNIPIVFLSALDDLQDKIKGFSVGGADYITKPFQDEEVLARVNSAISLRRMQRQLEEQNILLEKEIIERRKAEEALKKVNDELEIRVRERTEELLKAKNAAEAASRAKTAFLGNISHEFRTPLNPIIGMADVLLGSSKPGSDEHQYLKCISVSGRQLLGIVENLIELSRIEAEGIQPQIEPVQLMPFLRSAATNLSYNAKPKGLKVRYEIDSAIPDIIDSDSDLLLSILDRLGNNAVKFTEKGEIILSVRKVSEVDGSPALQWAVKDTGAGIPADRLKHIFEDFTQADSSPSRRYSGMGLGLTTVRRIVSHLGGRIWAESYEGKGSTFYFTLPFHGRGSE
ncbi:MAG TPA: hybrid sensor histidine kinase/response regulator [Desulfobacteraceae bacterium]|nr:hybrid sensor histidine kinase/response regulator [Desulfobacteraceae bacterium]